MNKSVNYVLELTPALKAPKGDSERSAACTQDCPHCPFSDHHPAVGVRFISDEVLEAFSLTQLAIKESCQLHRDSFSTISVPTGFPAEGSPPLFSKDSLSPIFSPRFLGFGLGDLSKVPAADLESSGLPQRLEALVPFQFDKKPTLHIDYRLPLHQLKASDTDLEKAVRLGKSLLQETRGDSYLFNPHELCYSETVNAYPRASDLMDPELVEDRNDQIRALIVELFPDDPLARHRVLGHGPSAEILSTHSVIHHASGVFTYGNRVIAKKASQRIPLAELKPDRLGISFFPDFVWINHSTHTIRDLTVRFSYEDYFDILQKTGGKGRVLKELLEARILERRLEARR